MVFDSLTDAPVRASVPAPDQSALPRSLIDIGQLCTMDGKRKLATDDIVAQALEEEGEKKRLKKNAVPISLSK